MKRAIKFVKQNIIGFIIGLLFMGIGVVTAATIIPATGVTYSNDSSNVSNVNEALDELFTKAGSGNFEVKLYQFNASANGGTSITYDLTSIDGYSDLVLNSNFFVSMFMMQTTGARFYTYFEYKYNAQNGKLTVTATDSTSEGSHFNQMVIHVFVVR